MNMRTNTPGLYFETVLDKAVTNKIKQLWVTDQNLYVSQTVSPVLNYVLYAHDCACLFVSFSFSTVCHPLHISSVKIKRFIMEYHLTHLHLAHSYSLMSVIKKKQADHSDWYNPTDLLHSCLHYRVTQVMTPDVFTEGQGGEQGRGIWWPPEREC